MPFIPTIPSTSPATTFATAGVNQIFRGVTFAPITGQMPQFYNAVCKTNGFALCWSALLNRNCTVQYKGNLNSTNWQTLTNLTTTAPEITVFDPATTSGANRFYRVRMNP